VLFEFPEDIARDEAKWQDTATWPMVMPNLRSRTRLHHGIAALNLRQPDKIVFGRSMKIEMLARSVQFRASWSI
jgi:hypothetical protein